jgi:hypothetical protein
VDSPKTTTRRWSGGAARRGGVRQRWRALVVTDDTALVLHHGERGRKVRWGPRKARRGVANGSPSGRTTVASWWKSGRRVTALASEAGRPILGRTGEAVTCLSTGEKERGKRGAGRRSAPFCGGSVAWQRGKGGGGPALFEATRRKRRRGPVRSEGG